MNLIGRFFLVGSPGRSRPYPSWPLQQARALARCSYEEAKLEEITARGFVYKAKLYLTGLQECKF